MFGRLQLYYKQNESKCIPNLLLPGGYYIAKYEEGYYYRLFNFHLLLRQFFVMFVVSQSKNFDS